MAKKQASETVLTDPSRDAVAARIQARLDKYRLEQGDANPVPPDPPPGYGQFTPREDTRGGAIASRDKDAGGIGERAFMGNAPAPAPETPRLQGNPVLESPIGYSDHEPETGIVLQKGSQAPVITLPADENIAEYIRIPDWVTIDIELGHALIAQIQQELERGGNLLSRRETYLREQKGYTCAFCGAPIPDLRTAVGMRDYRDPQDPFHIIKEMWCSVRCYMSKTPAGQDVPLQHRGNR